jgi:UDP-glucose 4-epimerase
MAKVLITGGAGFIGSHVAEHFLAAGHTVHIVDDLSSGKRENLPAAAVFHHGDVRAADCAALVQAERFDIIAHLAAQIDVRKSLDDPRFDADVNIGGTLNLLEAVRALPAEARGRFVFVSTGGALYGDAERIPSPEDTPANPDSPYGIAKLSAELYLAAYARVHGIDGAVLRLGNVYGPRQDPHGEAGVVAIFCGRVLRGEALTIFGSGEQLRDYVYVGDVARAVVAAATQPLPPAGALAARAFNVGTGVGTSVIGLAQGIAGVAGREAQLVHAPKRLGELDRSELDAAKAAAILGWQPEVTLTDGLRKTYEWFKAR